MSKSIYNIQAEYLDLMNSIEEVGGDMTTEMEEQLAINIDEFEDKMNNYAELIGFLKSQIQFNNDKIEGINKLKATTINLVDRLKSNMVDALSLYGDTGKSGNKVLDTGEHKFFTRNIQVVSIADEDDFKLSNADYIIANLKEKLTKSDLVAIMDLLRTRYEDENRNVAYDYKVNLKLLKEDLKNNVEIDGVMLNTNTSITIK